MIKFKIYIFFYWSFILSTLNEEGDRLEGTWSVNLDDTRAVVVVFRLWSDTGIFSFHSFSINRNDIVNSGDVHTIDGLPFWISLYNTNGGDSVLGDSEVYAVSRPILVTSQSCYDLLTGTKLAKHLSNDGLDFTYEFFGGPTMSITASAFRLDY